MRADPKARQRAAGAALAARRGDIEVSVLDAAARQLFDTMTPDELEALVMTGGSRAAEPARKPG